MDLIIEPDGGVKCLSLVCLTKGDSGDAAKTRDASVPCEWELTI